MRYLTHTAFLCFTFYHIIQTDHPSIIWTLFPWPPVAYFTSATHFICYHLRVFFLNNYSKHPYFQSRSCLLIFNYYHNFGSLMSSGLSLHWCLYIAFTIHQIILSVSLALSLSLFPLPSFFIELGFHSSSFKYSLNKILANILALLCFQLVRQHFQILQFNFPILKTEKTKTTGARGNHTISFICYY